MFWKGKTLLARENERGGSYWQHFGTIGLAFDQVSIKLPADNMHPATVDRTRMQRWSQGVIPNSNCIISHHFFSLFILYLFFKEMW